MKHFSYLPIELEQAFKDTYPTKLLFGSVATIANQQPRIRMMRIYEFDENGCPILLTHTASNKWNEFKNHPKVSINIVSENKLSQIIVRGDLILDTLETAQEKAQEYWKLVRSDVKKIYDPRHKIEEVYSETDDLNISEMPPHTFGIACVVPSFWEILQLESEYTKSYRYQFHLSEGIWHKERVHVG